MSNHKLTIHLIAAARPNFMKIAPLYHELVKRNWASPVVVHTGQHYDVNMSDSFFQDLNLPEPHIHLGIGSGSHAEQTGRVMIAYERILKVTPPDLVVVVGDVNSTVAASLAAVKLGIKVAHLEAGLRSFDRTMPEAINRVVTDAVADILWTPSPDGDENLLREGINPAKICRVGNIMIDSLEMMRSRFEQDEFYKELGLSPAKFGIVTLHRPANVDSPESLGAICRGLLSVSKRFPLVFPVHPRTRKNLNRFDLAADLEICAGIILLEPLSYIRFMSLVFRCGLAIKDSGGIQEETTYLGTPCLTLRPNTERPVTVDHGTNRLCGVDELEATVEVAMEGSQRIYSPPGLWDGHTAGRVADHIFSYAE